MSSILLCGVMNNAPQCLKSIYGGATTTNYKRCVPGVFLSTLKSHTCNQEVNKKPFYFIHGQIEMCSAHYLLK